MARVNSLAGLPIEQHNSPNVGGAMSAHRGSVLHIAEGTYRGTISWQMNPDQRYASGEKTTTSSTWIVGKNRGEWAQMSDTNTVAWCQRSGSLTRNSIELAGHAGDKPTAWQIEACAQIFAWEHLKYGVPLQVADTDAVLGLCHHSADREWAGVEWGHDDCPGSGVIAAKPAIVARAKEIIEGGDDVSKQDVLDGLAEFFSAEKTVQGAYLKNASNIVADLARGNATTETWFPGDPPGAEKMDLVPNKQLAEIKTLLGQLVAQPVATVDTEALAASIVSKLPPTGLTRSEVEDAVKEALREGTGAA